MPTNANAYNSRLTDETLEKRFRDTFRSQGGAELVDDLYASGVIVPVVDFTAAAEGSSLREDLQSAWDFSTGHDSFVGTTSGTLISNAGFWKIDLNVTFNPSIAYTQTLSLTDGFSSKIIWAIQSSSATANDSESVVSDTFVAFLRSGDSLAISQTGAASVTRIWYRQIATVTGDFVNPSGFTSS